jgi:hypothetical protein
MAAPVQQLLSAVRQPIPVTYDSLINAAAPVHRWKFTETSGNFIDSVAGLALSVASTPSNLTYSQTPLAGVGGGAILLNNASNGAHFIANAGSIPYASVARTVCVVFKPTDTTTQQMFFWGAQSSFHLFGASINDGGAGFIVADIFNDGETTFGTGCNTLAWHLLIVRAMGTNIRDFTIFLDSFSHAQTISNTPNTTGSANGFIVGGGLTFGTKKGTYYLDDIAIFARGLSDAEITAIKATLGF